MSSCLLYTSPPNKRKILYVDTEQSKYHCHKVMERILRLAGLPTDKDRDDFVFIVLREQTPDKRKQIIGYMLENMPDVGLLIIDGIRDLMYDINSPSESTDLKMCIRDRCSSLNGDLYHKPLPCCLTGE